ncbi:helix-turn-helix domain protein [Streptococcus pneumoniae]|nr:helix-turn-helix domain protein [Streptococcus pneumoniae]
MTILLNLSTLYLYNQDKNMCKQICYTLLEDAKNKKSYDRLAICYVRIGICRDNAKLIQKGFSLLEADRGNFYAVSSQKRSRDLLPSEGKIKKPRELLDLFIESPNDLTRKYDFYVYPNSIMTFFSKVNISHFFNDKKEADNLPTSCF